MFLSKHRLNIALLRIGKHRIDKNIASLRKLNIAHASRFSEPAAFALYSHSLQLYLIPSCSNAL